MPRHDLHYARTEHQQTLGTTVRKGGLAVLSRLWPVLAIVLVLGITAVAWVLAGYIAGRPRSFWRPTIGVEARLVVGQFAGYIGLAFALLMLVVWSRGRRTARLRRAMLLLSQIRMAVNLNLPLPATLGSAAFGESGLAQRQLLQLRDSLQHGLPIAHSLQLAAPELSQRTIATVRAAEANGTLEPAIDRLIAEQMGRTRLDATRFAVQRMYSLLTLVAFGGVVGTLTVFVVPKFEQILRDFDVPAPPALVLMVSLFRDVWPLVAFFIVWGMLLVMARNAARVLFVRAAPRPIFKGWFDRLAWSLPVWHALARDQGLADTFELLADGLEHGRPAGSALELAILPTTNTILARRLHDWQELVAHGRPLHEAAGAVGLPQLIVALLAPAPYTANMADACRFLSRYYRDRNERLLAVLRAAYTPTVTLLLGWLVLMTAASIFTTMLLLSEAVSGWLPGVRP